MSSTREYTAIPRLCSPTECIATVLALTHADTGEQIPHCESDPGVDVVVVGDAVVPHVVPDEGGLVPKAADEHCPAQPDPHRLHMAGHTTHTRHALATNSPHNRPHVSIRSLVMHVWFAWTHLELQGQVQAGAEQGKEKDGVLVVVPHVRLE